MRIIKIQFKCSICGNSYEHKTNPDSRGFFIMPNIHCVNDYSEMSAIIDGHKKDPGGEENGEEKEVDGLDKSVSK